MVQEGQRHYGHLSEDDSLIVNQPTGIEGSAATAIYRRTSHLHDEAACGAATEQVNAATEVRPTDPFRRHGMRNAECGMRNAEFPQTNWEWNEMTNQSDAAIKDAVYFSIN